jgi:signal recognition particle subunit SRP54
MGSIGKLLDMMPGAIGKISSQVSPQEAENQLKKTEAIINSMTIAERRKPAILNASRRRRIAKGSGTQVQDVNRLIKQYKDAKKMFKLLNKGGKRNISRLLGF